MTDRQHRNALFCIGAGIALCGDQEMPDAIKRTMSTDPPSSAELEAALRDLDKIIPWRKRKRWWEAIQMSGLEWVFTMEPRKEPK